jgi:transcriptional regulator with XRE-family HTH domain
MTLTEWIKSAQNAGWLVNSTKEGEVHLSCGSTGCLGCVSRQQRCLGPVLEPCSFDHTGKYALKTYETYEALVTVLREKRRMLGISQEDVGAAAGLADGHVGKLESLVRTAQLPTIQLWASTLGLEITLTPALLPVATTRAIEGRLYSPYDTTKAHFKHDRPKSAAIDHD